MVEDGNGHVGLGSKRELRWGVCIVHSNRDEKELSFNRLVDVMSVLIVAACVQSKQAGMEANMVSIGDNLGRSIDTKCGTGIEVA